jgi:hypothetical protein
MSVCIYIGTATKQMVGSSFEDALLSVWQQALVNDAKTVEVEGKSYAVLRTLKRRLRQVDFIYDGQELRGLEQNPDAKSRWAGLAQSGKKVMQFLTNGRYVAVVADGKITLYSPKSARS